MYHLEWAECQASGGFLKSRHPHRDAGKVDGPSQSHAKLFSAASAILGPSYQCLVRSVLTTQIVDEADRLLAQSFQDWLSQVLSHIDPPTKPPPPEFERQPDDAVSPHWQEALGLADFSFEGGHPVRGTVRQKSTIGALTCSAKNFSFPPLLPEILQRSLLSNSNIPNTTSLAQTRRLPQLAPPLLCLRRYPNA